VPHEPGDGDDASPGAQQAGADGVPQHAGGRDRLPVVINEADVGGSSCTRQAVSRAVLAGFALEQSVTKIPPLLN
jgi:hypothetical protein